MDKNQLINHLREEGFSEKILDAFFNVKREDFIFEEYKKSAYEDIPLPIGLGQTISQPYTIAFMLGLLEIENKDNLKILEIGSGSGYVLALINEISKNSKIYGIERIKELAEKSMKVLKDYKNIKVIYGNGSKGLKEEAPFDRILVSASAEKLPENLYSQLKDNGIMVCVVENSIFQIKRNGLNINKKEYPGFVFVLLVED
ncbi:MAG: protein-L-isoaspartate O-methyltransferase [Nanoarchaeota archaeon]